MEERYLVGIDIGGTSVKLGLFNETAKLISKWGIETKKSYSADELITKISDSIKEVFQNNRKDIKELVSVGMGVPGSVDESGIVRYAPNIGWSMYDAAGKLAGELNVPVKIANDANVAALGELKFGSAKDKNSLCFITLGTGVGGGIIVNGKMVYGFNGCGGEIGHITVNPNETKPCNCGRYGCLEQYASATGIARIAQKYISDDKQKKSLLHTYSEVSAKEVFDCVKKGDELAILIAEEFGKILGEALSNIACIFNPQIFVIGGGVSKAGNILLDFIHKYYVDSAYSDCKKTEFAIATLGNDAGIYGALSLAMENCYAGREKN